MKPKKIKCSKCEGAGMDLLQIYKRSLDGFVEQDISGVCPSCGADISIWIENIIGWGDYPVGGFRNSMKPNNSYGLGFECSKCFEQSCHYAGMKYIKGVIENVDLGRRMEEESREDY